MIKTICVALVLASSAGAALAQPGATPPTEPPPAPAPQPPVDQPPPVEFDPKAPLDEAQMEALSRKLEPYLPSLESVAKGTFRRFRRSISIGPTVGLWTGAIIDPGDIDAAITFGLGIEKFKVPVLPDLATIKALIIERVKAKLKDQIVERFKGRVPSPLELDSMAQQVFEEVRDEFLGLKNVRSKTLERPAYTFGIEANRTFSSERWYGRMRVGLGWWKLTVALSASFGKVCRGAGCNPNVKAFIGPEVVLHALTSKNPRASVFDMFLRVDIQATGRLETATYDQLIVGVRYLVDVF